MIIACKKWHVAKRLVGRIRTTTGLPAVDYLFNEETTPLPDLGGIQKTLEKRTRHRRALMRMLFDWFGTDRLVICMDTASLDLMHDFFSDRSVTRLLEIECLYSDDFLSGHAKRIGLAGEQTDAGTLDRLLPTIRNAINDEADLIRDAGFARYGRISETAPDEANAAVLAEFLTIPHATALGLVQGGDLFV